MVPVPLLRMFDKQLQFRMGRANVLHCVRDILPPLTDEGPSAWTASPLTTHRWSKHTDVRGLPRQTVLRLAGPLDFTRSGARRFDLAADGGEPTAVHTSWTQAGQGSRPESTGGPGDALFGADMLAMSGPDDRATSQGILGAVEQIPAERAGGQNFRRDAHALPTGDPGGPSR